MRWRGRARSTNIEDRRGMRPTGMAVGGGLGGLVLLLVLSFLTGQNPADFIQTGPATAPSYESTGVPGDDPDSEFLSVVLADTEKTWSDIFASAGGRYQAPTLVLFTQATQSACGLGQSAMGPFYCPADRRLYLDVSFFHELSERFGAPGEFARAYVVAHEVGHHIQTLTGVSEQIQAARQRVSEAQANALSVRQELQADCFAGVWGYYAAQRGMLEPGDAEDGLRAAAAIGDDRLQQQGQGRVVPESFTHGSSAQRVEWFRRGLQSGQIDACDTLQ